MIRTIPLTKLRPSARNVRRVTDEQADLQLKADIAARGLLQNLVVAPAKKPKGSFTVEAGGRRLKALQALAEDGVLDKDHEVSCLFIDGGPAAAQEAGLAENFQRLAMNPADECIAFQQLIEQGADVEGIARRFGLTVRFVEGRLRLAGLAPVVFEALGAGEITLDVAKAYAATPERERQAFVFEQVSRSYMSSHPDSIRRMMTQATAGASDRRARFVGEEAYVGAGGRIERDLFSDEDNARWLDIALLERLATEKLEALAGETAASEGLAFVQPTLEPWVGYEHTRGLERILLETPPLSEDEAAEIERLESDIEELVTHIDTEEMDEEARVAAEAQVHELSDRVDAIANKPPVLPDELRACAGTFLLLDEEGRPRLERSYYREPQPEPELDEPDGQTGEREDGCVGGAASAATEVAPAAPKGTALSQALVDELAIQRRDILAVHVAADPSLALDLAIFLMVDREAGYSCEKRGSSLVALPPSDPVFGFKTPDAAATRAREQAVETLSRSWTGGDTLAGRFDAFRALPEDARAAWLGHAVARTLEASLNHTGSRACAFHDHLGDLLGIEVAQWWRPTGANYFDRVPKAVTLAALEEVGGPAFAARYAKAKKAELAESCQRIFSGDFIGEVEVKEKALAWVPEAMRFAAPPPAEPATAAPVADDLPPWEEEAAADQAEAPAAQASEAQADEPGGGEAIVADEGGSTEPCPADEQERGGSVHDAASPEPGEGLEQAA